MTRTLRSLSLVLVTFVSLPVAAQSTPWTTEKSSDGATTVKSRISTNKTTDGETQKLLEYVATTRTDGTVADVVAVLKDGKNHGAIIDEKVTKTVRQISPESAIVYYYLEAPWPLSDSDIVTRMNVETTPDGDRAKVTLRAAPSEHPDRGVTRMRTYDVDYVVKKLDDGKVELTTRAKMAPPMQVPEFMMKSFFPDGPADILKRWADLAKRR